MKSCNYLRIKLFPRPIFQFLRGRLIRFALAIHTIAGDSIEGVGHSKYAGAYINVFAAQTGRIT